MPFSMDHEDFEAIKHILEGEFGLSLRSQTPESIGRKIRPRLEALRMKSVREYIHFLSHDPQARFELHDLPSWIMNTESYFLREYAQFELFIELYRKKRRKLPLQKNRKISILSAGCSEGQEPYSIAMLLRNHFDRPVARDARIYAMDINLTALEKARGGAYGSYSLRGGQGHLIEKYFDRSGGEATGDGFRLKPEILSSIEYIHGNILHPLVLKGICNLDFIFCRNLLMYMSEQAAEKIVFSLWEALDDEGFLFVGQSETLRRDNPLFEPIRFPEVTLYRKKKPLSAA